MFAHLHTHTEYSELDGLSKIAALTARAKRLGQDSLAITDHGNLYGAIEFYRAARSEGLRPVLGMEAYVAPGDRREREAGREAATNAYHLVLLAENNTGWRNLIQLSTRAHLEGFYYRPRVDRELLAEYSEGVIVLSAVPQANSSVRCKTTIWNRRTGSRPGTARPSATATTSRSSVTTSCPSSSRP